jgi:hypothetical protein
MIRKALLCLGLIPGTHSVSAELPGVTNQPTWVEKNEKNILLFTDVVSLRYGLFRPGH